AQGGEAVAALACAEAVEQGGGHAGAGGAPGVAERDRPAVDVELVVVDAEILGGRQHLRGEGLVELDQVDVVDGHVGERERPTGRLDGPEPHDLGADPGDAGGDHTGQ